MFIKLKKKKKKIPFEIPSWTILPEEFLAINLFQ